MKILDLITLSTRAFSARPMRTFLTIFGVSVGIGAVLFLVSLGYGLQNVVLNKITTADALLSLDVSAGATNTFGLNNDTVNQIKSIPEIAEISPVINMSAQIQIDNLSGDGLVYAVEPSFFRLSGITAINGGVFSADDNNSIVISSADTKLFNLTPKEIIGKEAYLTLFQTIKNDDGTEETRSSKRDTKYVIKGIIDDDNTSFVYIPAKTIADLNIDKYSEMKVKVAKDTDLETARNKIMALGYTASSLSDTIDQAKKIFQIVQIILALFGMIALAVSAIGMFNTMTVTLLERINEIGIMRSIGASSTDIKMMFLLESVMMGFLGGVGGIIIGYVGGLLANFAINLLARNFGGQSMNLFYSPLWFVVFILTFSTIIGFLTGIYPSRRASNLNPLEALRYK